MMMTNDGLKSPNPVETIQLTAIAENLAKNYPMATGFSLAYVCTEFSISLKLTYFIGEKEFEGWSTFWNPLQLEDFKELIRKLILGLVADPAKASGNVIFNLDGTKVRLIWVSFTITTEINEIVKSGNLYGPLNSLWYTIRDEDFRENYSINYQVKGKQISYQISKVAETKWWKLDYWLDKFKANAKADLELAKFRFSFFDGKMIEYLLNPILQEEEYENQGFGVIKIGSDLENTYFNLIQSEDKIAEERYVAEFQIVKDKEVEFKLNFEKSAEGSIWS